MRRLPARALPHLDPEGHGGAPVWSGAVGWSLVRAGGLALTNQGPLDLAFTEEFLGLLSVLEATVAMYPALESLLGRVVAGPTFSAAELPSPTDAERAAPSAPSAPEEQPMLGLE